MNEKRFYISSKSNQNIYDTEKKCYYSSIDAKKLCELLNELIEENKELKERNNRQYKQLDDLCQLIEQKDWRALSDIMDDFKKADEKLQSEWQTYGDEND